MTPKNTMALYPMMAIGAGYIAWRLWNIALLTRIAVIGLLLWQVSISVMSFPDHLTYFNELAGDKPERILLNGDLDWGQDLQRLGDAVRKHDIETIAFAYKGRANPSRLVPGSHPLPPKTPSTGWIAVSLFYKEVANHSCGGFKWLDAYEPVSRIGQSIDLYNIKALKPETLSGGFDARLCD